MIVGSGLGVGLAVGVGSGSGVGVGSGVGSGSGVGVGSAVGLGVGSGLGVLVATGVGVGFAAPGLSEPPPDPPPQALNRLKVSPQARALSERKVWRCVNRAGISSPGRSVVLLLLWRRAGNVCEECTNLPFVDGVLVDAV